MAKLVLALFASLDGFAIGPEGRFIPPPWSDETARRWAKANLDAAGAILYGRVNFEFNKGFWTSEAAREAPETAAMARLPKTVVTRTLAGDLGWNGRAAPGPLAETVAELKRTTLEGDVYSFGGPRLAESLMREGLVDEWRLMLSPQIFGGGARLFAEGVPHLDLELVSAETLDVGSVILSYRRAGAA